MPKPRSILLLLHHCISAVRNRTQYGLSRNNPTTRCVGDTIHAIHAIYIQSTETEVKTLHQGVRKEGVCSEALDVLPFNVGDSGNDCDSNREEDQTAANFLFGVAIAHSGFVSPIPLSLASDILLRYQSAGRSKPTCFTYLRILH